MDEPMIVPIISATYFFISDLNSFLNSICIGINKLSRLIDYTSFIKHSLILLCFGILVPFFEHKKEEGIRSLVVLLNYIPGTVFIRNMLNMTFV